MRRQYIDWLRGAAVVVMVMAHTMDSWTRAADRDSALFTWEVRIAGMGAPLFLFLAGVAVALSAGAKMRKGATTAEAASAVRNRGWHILGLALLFRFQAWFLSPGATLAGMLKVDILNVMGPAMALGATVWGLTTRPAVRIALLAFAASVFAVATPWVRDAAWLTPVPDPLEWYVRPPAGRSWFTMFPWAGLLLSGTAVGVAIDLARDPARERRMLQGLFAAGAAMIAAAWVGAYLPPLHPKTYFWTTSISYFVGRVGLMTLLLPVVALWLKRPTAHHWSPMLAFGASSLFVYWIHVEMVYGILSYPLHRALPIGGAFLAFLLFTGLMLWCAIVKTRVVERWTARERASTGPPVDAGMSHATMRVLMRVFGALLLSATVAGAQPAPESAMVQMDGTPFTPRHWDEDGLRGWRIADRTATAPARAQLLLSRQLRDFQTRLVVSLDRDDSDLTLFFRAYPASESTRVDAVGVRFRRTPGVIGELVTSSNGRVVATPSVQDAAAKWRDGFQEVDLACRDMYCAVAVNGTAWVTIPAAHPAGSLRFETEHGGVTLGPVLLTPPEPQASPWAGAQQVGSDAGIAPPTVKREVKPAYTYDAMRAGAQGTVWVECVVDQTGKVVAARLARALDRGLDDAALATARKWRFNPARDAAGRPVSVVVVIEMAFKLKK